MPARRAAFVTAALALLLAAPPAAAKPGSTGDRGWLTAASPREIRGIQDKPASAFVPAGFRVEHRLSLQLDADGRPDRVLVLRRKRKVSAGTADRRLVVIRGAVAGGYSLAGEGRRILLCSSCGGAFFGGLAAPVEISSSGRTLVVKQSFGSRNVIEQTFRLALRRGGVKLIGYDEIDRDRATGAWTSTSTNLLTGTRITERRRRGRKTVRTTTSVKVRPIALARVDRDHPLRP